MMTSANSYCRRGSVCKRCRRWCSNGVDEAAKICCPRPEIEGMHEKGFEQEERGKQKKMKGVNGNGGESDRTDGGWRMGQSASGGEKAPG